MLLIFFFVKMQLDWFYKIPMSRGEVKWHHKINQLNLECGIDLHSLWLAFDSDPVTSFFYLFLGNTLREIKPSGRADIYLLLLEACGKDKEDFCPRWEGCPCLLLYFLLNVFWPKLHLPVQFLSGSLFRKKGTFVSLLLKNIILSLILLLIVIYMMPWQEAQNGQRINGLWYNKPHPGALKLFMVTSKQISFDLLSYSVSDA